MVQQVAYLGPIGTFGWYVAMRSNPLIKLVPYNSHAQVIEAVVKGEVDQGFIARENSIGGSVSDTVDPLIGGSVGISMRLNSDKVVVSSGNAMVCGEVILPVVQCLYGRPGQINEIKRVYSHPQGLAQCEGFIARRFPQAQLMPANSTVGGVEKLREDAEAVAIAPPWVRYLYQDVVLAEEGIQDWDGNATRFLLVGKKDCLATGSDKTSICFQVPGDEQPGSFDRVSQIFACCGVNKRLVESRPAKTALGNYVFLVDLDGHRLDSVLRLAFELIVMAGLTTSFRILGSYPRWRNGG